MMLCLAGRSLGCASGNVIRATYSNGGTSMQLISVRSLAARLSLGFGVILALLLGMAVLSLLRMQALSATLEDITVHSAARSQTLDVMGRSVSR